MQSGIIRGSSSFLPSYLESLVRHLAVKNISQRSIFEHCPNMENQCNSGIIHNVKCQGL